MEDKTPWYKRSNKEKLAILAESNLKSRVLDAEQEGVLKLKVIDDNRGNLVLLTVDGISLHSKPIAEFSGTRGMADRYIKILDEYLDPSKDPGEFPENVPTLSDFIKNPQQYGQLISGRDISIYSIQETKAIFLAGPLEEDYAAAKIKLKEEISADARFMQDLIDSKELQIHFRYEVVPRMQLLEFPDWEDHRIKTVPEVFHKLGIPEEKLKEVYELEENSSEFSGNFAENGPQNLVNLLKKPIVFSGRNYGTHRFEPVA